MKWNWQQKDWPRFRYDAKAIASLEEQFLHRSGLLIGAYKHISEEEKATLTVDLISNEALKTSEIEGEPRVRPLFEMRESLNHQEGSSDELCCSEKSEDVVRISQAVSRF